MVPVRQAFQQQTGTIHSKTLEGDSYLRTSAFICGSGCVRIGTISPQSADVLRKRVYLCQPRESGWLRRWQRSPRVSGRGLPELREQVKNSSTFLWRQLRQLFKDLFHAHGYVSFVNLQDGLQQARDQTQSQRIFTTKTRRTLRYRSLGRLFRNPDPVFIPFLRSPVFVSSVSPGRHS
jgi:hypothetical protein